MSIFYLDFSNLRDTLTVAYAEIPEKQKIDTTDIGINDKKQTWAITFRVGDDWLTNPCTEFTPAFRYYHEFTQQGKPTYQNIGAHQRNNKISFGYTFDYFTGLEINTADFKPYRNRWLALVSATSDSTSDFKNWEYPKHSNPHQYCVRHLLIDIEAETIIGKFDTYAYNIKDKIDLTQSWYAADNMDKTDNDYHDRRFLLLGKTDKHTQAENQLQILSAWVAIGSCLDPVKFWPDITGSNLQQDINGTRAWSTLEFNNQTIESLTTSKQFIKSNSRWPDIYWTTKLYNYTPMSEPVKAQPLNNRTIRFFGLGFGKTPAEIRVIYRPPDSWYEVFYCEIPTIDADVPDPLNPELQQVLFTIQLPINFTGQIPMSIHCTKGTAVIITKMDANYCYEDSLNPRYTDQDRLILDNPNSTAADRARIWRSRAVPPFNDRENAIIDRYIENPVKATYQVAKTFFSHHGLASVSSGPELFRASCFEGDARLNCCLNEVPIVDTNKRDAIEKTLVWPGKLGTFERIIPQHSTLTFDLKILAGML